MPFPQRSTRLYSASRGALGGVLFTCTPPLFFSLLSGIGSAQPPSSSGVDNHNLRRCLLGAGGGKSVHRTSAIVYYLNGTHKEKKLTLVLCP